eukprot:530140_1
MGCIQAIASCAGLFELGGTGDVGLGNKGWIWSSGVSVMQHFCADEDPTNIDIYSGSCSVPIFEDDIIKSAINICCYDGYCCATMQSCFIMSDSEMFDISSCKNATSPTTVC